MMAPNPANEAQILDEAAAWLAHLNSGTASTADHAACRCWQMQSPAHADAWAHAEVLLGKLEALPPTLAMAALDRPASKGRRTFLSETGRCAALFALLPAGWFGWQAYRASHLYADHHTAVGIQRSVQLADGSRLTLNTDTRLNIRFSANERLVELIAGEILVDTAPDPAPEARPFRVATQDGRLEALGTRFSVRQMAEFSSVAVLEGAIRLTPRLDAPTDTAAQDSGERTVRAGQQSTFTAGSNQAPQPLDLASVVWLQGMLLADNMRLDAVAAELARYRPGIVHCSGAVAGLRVSGAFPVGSVAATERSLGMLVSTYPLLAEQRLGGLWVSLGVP